MYTCECVSVHLDSINITFGLFKIFYFYSCLFSMVFTWNFQFYFQVIFWKNLVSFWQLFTPVILPVTASTLSWLFPALFSLRPPLAHFSPGCPFFSIQFLDVTLFLISFLLLLFPYVPSLLIASFFPFPSYNIGFVCLSETCHICIMIFWDEEIELTSKCLPFSICFLRNIRSFRSFISIQNQGAFTKLLILFQS